MNSKTNVLVILTTKEYYNNYILTGALDKVMEDFEVTLLAPSSLVQRNLHNKYVLDVLPDSVFIQDEKSFVLMTDLLRRKYRKKSKSFKYRDKRINQAIWKNLIQNLRNEKARLKNALNEEIKADKIRISQIVKIILFSLKIHSKNFIESSKRFLRQLLILILVKPIIFSLAKQYLEKRICTPEYLDEYLVKKSFSIVVMPSAAFEPTVVHIAKAKTKQSFQFLLIIDNWDNLSSKTVLWHKPDYIATWGLQSSEHAVNIQNFQKTKLFEIGTARFTSYFESQGANNKKLSNEAYVLFIGTFLKFNEYACLEIISNEINSHPEVYGKLKIVYRPHPFAKIDEEFFKNTLNNVYLDRDISFFQSSPENTFLNFGHSIKQQQNAEFIVGGLSSMLIESSILGKKYLALVHREKRNIASPHRVFESYEHFKKLQTLPNLQFVKNLDELSIMFRRTYLSKTLDQQEINKFLNYFYDIRPITFSEKLAMVLKQINQLNGKTDFR